jgi:glycerophosphoryl diester phosphodiesterase
VGVAVLVFGHRGACGYLPENTMESFELAFQLGSDAIEFDVVMTKDGHPVILHDEDLTLTTTVAQTSLPARVSELTLQELKTLRAKERYPARAESASHDGAFEIPTLAEVLANPSFDGKHLIVEVKFGREFLERGLNIVEATAVALEQSSFKARGIEITLECFEFGILQKLRDRIKGAKFVFLSAPDMLPTGFTELTDELLAEIASEFDGVSVAIPMLFQNNLVARSKQLGMSVFAYTARVETAEGDVDSWFRKLIATGVDGLFADQPDRLVNLVRANP